MNGLFINTILIADVVGSSGQTVIEYYETLILNAAKYWFSVNTINYQPYK